MNNSAIGKFNVEKITVQQEQQLTNIQHYIECALKSGEHHIVVIEGQAGTGKSVLLTKLFQRLKAGATLKGSPYYQKQCVFTVNHPELLKIYQELGRQLPGIYKKDYVRPTSLINDCHKTKKMYDIVLVDEGHLLFTKPEPYIRFTQENQLSEIIKLSRVVVVVFDFKQVMQTKMFWNKPLLDKVLAPYKHVFFNLDFQYRMQASQATIEWIDGLTNGQILPLPSNRGDYDLRIYSRAYDLYEAIKQRNIEVGLSRMLTATGFTRGPHDEHTVRMDDFNQPWDELDAQPTPWAERSESITEVGSIYTIQGFDLNYAGVILSPAFEYDATTDSIVVNPDKVTHTEIYKKTPRIQSEQEMTAFKSQVMFNTLNVLLKRGIKGLYVTAADPQLRKRLLEL
ncbi:DUF2075 domain-containing protein [Convivina praedatoris]|uniref:Schlafen group 3-like DNA/RNA helicase domain-containing protein n=1 Tax=Convivina praedatoris TaxID=2880963 RepID=A0ABM9D3H0_9LACO|nr:DUF2075 domain-containing protein [Convivina sp. LMG 32447]CAH1856976.1 hypothetical protein R077815_01517 [Convivina sp. LMG 32447]CAH1857254.1 hypothetical protein R078138_01549 [Convivina sp. LMG 32447]CAH1857452.1 hypothetical protein LMG032447_01549 [Convivina sp. LMG 32447]